MRQMFPGQLWHEIRLLCPLGRVKLFLAVDIEGQVNVRYKEIKFPIW